MTPPLAVATSIVITGGGYRWFAESSQDRKQTFTKNPTIGVTPGAAENTG